MNAEELCKKMQEEKKADSEFAEVKLLSEITRTEIPEPIAALENKTARFKDICEKQDMLNAVYSSLNIK